MLLRGVSTYRMIQKREDAHEAYEFEDIYLRYF